MIVVSAATGHIGSHLVKELVSKKQDVAGITSNPRNASRIEATGAKAAVVNIYDTPKLKELLRKADRFYMLNPPGDISKDPSDEERKSVEALVSAAKDSGLEKIVAESTYGAQPGEKLGDLDVLYEMEQKLAQAKIPHEIIRGAYYFSNWDMSLESAKAEGKSILSSQRTSSCPW